MKKQKICPVCNNNLKIGEAAFPFPRLPVSYRYSKFAGMVHVSCLLKSSEADAIRKELTEAYRNYSPYPIIYQVGGILVQKHERDECVVIYDFDDFAIFQIPNYLRKKILDTHTENQFKLDVNGFVQLLIGKDLGLNLHKPFSEEKIMLSSLPLKTLNKMLNNILVKDNAEICENLIIEQIKSSPKKMTIERIKSILDNVKQFLFLNINNRQYLNKNNYGILTA